MISICIPLYNYYALPLVKRLSDQTATGGDYEIVCIDDHSSDESFARNRGIEELAKVVRLGENVGRARIRNMFLRHAKGDYLLFLDNDMLVPDGFLRCYAATLAEAPQVVVGGVAYDTAANDAAHSLRYLYGIRVESRSAEARQRHPYRSFMTGNFMIARGVLERIRFDESLHRYGHEDTLFGYELRKNGVPILHIDNQAINGQVETNAEYLRKTAEGVGNLALIYRRMEGDRAFCRSVRLLRAYDVLRSLGMERAVGKALLGMNARVERRIADGGGLPLWRFNLYKLGILINEINES